MDPQLLRVIDKTTSPRISSAISIIMLRAMGSRIMFSVLATLVLVLLTSTLTSATPVARWALDEYDQQDNSNMLRTLPNTRGSRARQIQRPVKQEYVYSVCLPEDKYQQCQATCSASRSDAKKAYTCMKKCGATDKGKYRCPNNNFQFDYNFGATKPPPRKIRCFRIFGQCR